MVSASLPAPGGGRRWVGGLALLACLALCAPQAGAAPAPWYQWRSRIDGRLLCAQTSPGPGWERQAPPFEGPGCQPRRKVLVVPLR